MNKKIFLILPLIILTGCASQNVTFSEKEGYVFNKDNYTNYNYSTFNDDFVEQTNYYGNIAKSISIIDKDNKDDFNLLKVKNNFDYRFRNETYTIYSSTEIDAGILKSDNYCSFTFIDCNEKNPLNKLNLQVQIVESNGVYGYAINSINASKRDDIMYLALNTDFSSYDVYFRDGSYTLNSTEYFFFGLYIMPIDNRFSKEYVKEFNLDQNIHQIVF